MMVLVILTLAMIGFYIVLIPKVRGTRGQPRYTAFRSIPGLWLASVVIYIGLHLGTSVIAPQTFMWDHYLYDTHYVVANYHYLAFVTVASMLIAFFILCFSTIVRARYHPVLAGLQCAMWIAGISIMSAPQILIGFVGGPKRILAGPEFYAYFNQIAAIGAYVTLASLAVLVCIVIEARIRKRPMLARSTPTKSL